MPERSASVLFRVCVVLCLASACAGAPGAPKQKATGLERVSESFDDFEKPRLVRYWHAADGAETALVNAGVTGGKQALRVTFRNARSTLRYRRTGLDGYGANHSRSLQVLGARFIFHNAFVFDVLNPGKESVPLVVTFAGRPFVFSVKPGANTISIPTEEIAAGVYRMTRATERITFSVREASETALIFDSLRLERTGVGVRMKRHAKCFDFGPADMCRPGFTAVGGEVAYESQRGYGWLAPNVYEEKGKLTTIKSSGAIPLGDLLRDGVKDLSSPFVVDVPNGRYRVHIVGGYHWGGIYHLMPIDYDFTIKVEGEVKHIRLRAGDQLERVRRMYGHDRTRYTFGEDLWSVFGRPVYGPIVFDAEVVDGQLTLEFLTSPQPDKGFLNFMVVYPVAQAEGVEHELKAVWEDVRRRYNRVSFRPVHPRLAVVLKKPDLHEEFLSLQRRIEKISVLTARPEYSGRDFMIYARDHLDQVYPDTVPDPEEKTTHLKATGGPGEIVPVTFSMFALHKVASVRVDVTALEGPQGRDIPADDVDVRAVRYSRRMLAQRSRGDWQYMVVPWYLVAFRTIDVERYMSRRFWLNLRLSPEVPPGRYTGTVRVATRRSGQVLLKLDLEVLPFRLRKPETGRFRAVYFVQPFNCGNEAYGQSVRRQKSERLPASHAQQVQETFERLHRQEIRSALEVLASYGFDTVYSGDWLTDIAEANRRRLEPLTLVHLPDVIRDARPRRGKKGKADGSVSIDRKRATAYLNTPASCTEETVRALRDERLKVYLGRPTTWMSVMDDASVARFVTGVYLWRLGADGIVVGPVRSSWGDPYHPFDGYGGERGSLLMPASRNWPRMNTSRILEEIREAINDYRYLATLEHLIRSAEKAPEAKQARDYLKRLRKEMSANLADYVEPTGRDTWRSKTDAAWSAERYTRLRRDLTTHILTLREVLGERDAGDDGLPERP